MKFYKKNSCETLYKKLREGDAESLIVFCFNRFFSQRVDAFSISAILKKDFKPMYIKK